MRFLSLCPCVSGIRKLWIGRGTHNFLLMTLFLFACFWIHRRASTVFRQNVETEGVKTFRSLAGDEIGKEHGKHSSSSRFNVSSIQLRVPSDASSSSILIPEHHLDVQNELSTKRHIPWGNVQTARRRLMQIHCSQRKSQTETSSRRGVSARSIVDRKNEVLYCPVEKSASTFFRRFMYALLDVDSFRKIVSPFKIPIKTALKYNFDFLRLTHPQSAMNVNVRFIVSREPYSRLYSAYVDKLVVPNNYYWPHWGVRAVLSQRRSPSERSRNCGHDVTFPEFVKYVITELHRSDEHVVPVDRLCSPCIANFSVLAHIETLRPDFEHLTSVLHVTIANVSVNDLMTQISYDAMQDSTYSAFTFYEDLDQCVSKHEMCQRLWQKMQLRGIIDEDISYPLQPSQSDDTTADSFLKILYAAHENSNDAEKLHGQKLRALKNAFAQVSSHDIDALIKIYSSDFEMFGYEKYPKFIL